MEDSVIVFFIMLSMIVVTFAVAFLIKFSGNKRKKAIKTVKEENIDTIVQSYANSIEILREQNEFIVQENKTIKKRLAAEIGVNLRSSEPQQEKEIKITEKNLQEHYEIDMLSGLKLVESMNLDILKNMDKSKLPKMLDNPIVKSAVWSYIKKNKDEMIELGVIIPKGQMVENAIKDSKEPMSEENDNGMMNLEFANDNAKYMA